MKTGGVKKIVIVGGDAVAWIAAATLSRALRPEFCAVCVLQPGTDAPARYLESTDSYFHRWLGLIGMDSPQFMRASGATINMGTRYQQWGSSDSYVHAFGPIGARLEGVAFHHHWLRLQRQDRALPIQRYSMSSQAAESGKFVLPVEDARSLRSLLSYGFTFESSRFVQALRALSEARGVVTQQGEVRNVRLDAVTGHIQSLELSDGSSLEADFFIDCTAEPQLLMQGALQCGYEDWRHWLPCDRALVMSAAGERNPPLLQESIAAEAGWRWSARTQAGGERGYAYASNFQHEEAAAAALSPSNVGEVRQLRFSPGRPRSFWHRNCLVLTAAAIAPMDDLPLHLAHTGIARLLPLFPTAEVCELDAQEYNRLTSAEHERARDLMILHLARGPAGGGEFWNHCRNMPLPDSLSALLELFTETGRLAIPEDDFVSQHRWLSVLLGQGVMPRRYDPIADTVAIEHVSSAFARLAAEIGAELSKMGSHERFLGSIHERC